MSGGGGASIVSTVRGTADSATTSNVVCGEGNGPFDVTVSSSPAARAGANSTSAATTSDLPAQRPRPYETLLAKSFVGIKDGWGLRGRGSGGGSGGSGGGVISARPHTAGSHQRRGGSRRQPLGFQVSNTTRGGEESAGGKYRQELQIQRKQLQPRVERRPSTEGAGTGGVPGVLARLGGYEKVTLSDTWYSSCGLRNGWEARSSLPFFPLVEKLPLQ